MDPQFNWTSPWMYWKPLFVKTHQNIFELEIWQPFEYFFLRPARSRINSPWEPTRTMTVLRRPSILENHFLWKRTRIFFELEIWQPIKYIFLRPARSTISSPWEPTRTMTLLCRPSIQFNKSLTVLKTTFYENAPQFFWARNLTTN